MNRALQRFEVHEHCIVRGPRANGPAYKFSHSHVGGNRAHQHPDTGPASFTIDKDQWYRATGLRGGGRKKYTAKPIGEQWPWVELDAEQRSFKVIVVGPPTPEFGEGPGLAPACRMALGFDMTFTIEDRR